MKKIVSLLTLYLTIVVIIPGCKSDNEVDHTLQQVEVIIEEEPERALEILRDIDATNLKGRKQKAHYSLLKSMALDKNYVDLTIFDTLQPAIDYYLNNGTPDEKLRTYYYQGRIYQNREEFTDALKSLQKGAELAQIVSDSLVLGRIFHSQGVIYNSFFNNKSAAEAQLRGAAIFKNLQEISKYNYAVISAISNYIQDDCKNEAEELLKNFDDTSLQSDEERSMLYSTRISFFSAYQNQDSLENLLKTNGFPEYLTTKDKLNVVYCLVVSGNTKSAEQLFDEIDCQSENVDSLQYFAVKQQLFETLGEYKEAYNALHEYIRLAENADYELLQQHSAIAEENHQHELNLIKSRGRQRLLTLIIVFAGVVIVLGVALSVYIARSINQKRKIAVERANVAHLESQRLLMENRIKELETQQLKAKNKVLNSENSSLKELTQEKEREICRINDLLNSVREDKDRLEAMVTDQKIIPEEVAAQVRNRIALLNALFYDYINDSEARTDHSDKLMFDTIGNIDEFLNATRLSYKVAYPAFISYLESKGLTDDEINYLCLYAIGLNGRQITKYIKRASHVNLSSSLRKKLGLSAHDTNISLYIKQLLDQCATR